MEVKMLSGTRRGQVIDLPEADAKKLIKKKMAESIAKKAPAKKKTTKKD